MQLNHLASLAKWLSVHLYSRWLLVQVQLQSMKDGSKNAMTWPIMSK